MQRCLTLSRAISAAEGRPKAVHRRWDPKLRIKSSDPKHQQHQQHEANQQPDAKSITVDMQGQTFAKCPQDRMGGATSRLAVPRTHREVCKGMTAHGAELPATPSTCAPSEDSIFIAPEVQQHVSGVELQRPVHDMRRASSAPRVTTAPVGFQYSKAGHKRSDKYTRDAHFKHVVPCRFFPGETDEDRESDMEHLDAQLGMALRGVGIGHLTLPSQQDGQPLPMAAAFTDRSARMREGYGLRNVMSFNGMIPANDASGSSLLGQPCSARPAGQLSCKVPGNELPVPHRGTDAKLARNKVSKLTEPKEESEEACFRRAMGVKAKQPVMQPATQNSTSSEQQQSATIMSASAGCFSPRRFDIELESAPHQARRRCQVDTGHRCDVAMIMMPKESDPPPLRQVTDCVKAEGACKKELSKPACMRQQQLDARSVLQRARSLPPKLARNPITSEGCDGGRSSNWDCHSSSRPMLFAAADVAELTNHALLSKEAVTARAERLASEKKFADLCTLAKATTPMGHRSLALLRNESSSMSSTLAWNA